MKVDRPDQSSLGKELFVNDVSRGESRILERRAGKCVLKKVGYAKNIICGNF